MSLSLETTYKIVETALAKGRELGLNPLTVCVLDSGGTVKMLAREDGTSTMRPGIAEGKAMGCIGLGIGGRAIFKRAQEQPYFIQAMNGISGGKLVPVPGGVLIKENGKIVGAVGITGDSSDNDEICAIAGIEAVGLTPDAG